MYVLQPSVIPFRASSQGKIFLNAVCIFGEYSGVILFLR